MRTVLQFGGGKDSLACLFLMRPRWQSLTVAWMNAGAPFPETLELMAEIRKLVPYFIEVRSDVLEDVARYGWPVDVVPVKNTAIGRMGTGAQGIRVRPWTECCGRNMWAPMDRALKDLGVTRVIRGQRNAELYKSPIRDGDVVNGVHYELPLQDWTEKQVIDYLHAEAVPIPDSYNYSDTSLDCWNCTAFLDSKLGQLRYMRERHAEKYSVVTRALREISSAIDSELRPLNLAVGAP